jgi:DNA-binding transcriptional LysR family regulator
LCIVDAYGGHLVDWLHRGEMDIAVIYGPTTSLHLPVESLRKDTLLAVGAPDSGLDATGFVDLAWLAERPLVLPSPTHGLRALVDAAMSQQRLEPNVRVEADSFGVLLEVVAGGIGLTLLPWYAVAAAVGRGELVVARVEPELTRELVLAMPTQHSVSVATQMVAGLIREEIQRVDDYAARPG